MELPKQTKTALCVLFTCFLLSDAQTTTFDPNSQVQVPDTRPSIVPNAQKIYTTSINLVKTSSSVIFQPNFFIEETGQFYASALAGFGSVNNVQNTNLDSSRIRVTYDVSYTFSTLNTSVSASDDAIANAIGTFVPVRNGLNSQPDLIALFLVEDDPNTFAFSGSSMCSVATCTGSYVSCNESTSGINVICVADCKNGYCKNGATCSQSGANSPPVCTCLVLPDLWYIGTQCETQITLWLIILLSVIGFIIIVVVIIATCCCVVRRRRRRRYKEKLANMPLPSRSNGTAGQQNSGFVNDEDRAAAVPQTKLVPRSLPGMSIDREDSFDTVTSNGSSRHDRRSYATSRTNSTHRDHHRHHHHHHDSHHRRHHRDHRRRSRSRESDRHHRRSRRISSSSEAESEPETVDDQKNLSFYEIDVKSLISDSSSAVTEPTASIAADSTTNRSPIRWLPPKGIETRPGWVPSLGPMMYDLKKSNDDLAIEPEDNRNTGYETITFNRTKGDTDL